MLATVALLLSTCGMVRSSGFHPIASAGTVPIVTAASSQYFERTFNRLVAATPVFEPVFPVAPAPLPPPIAVTPVRPIQPVFQPEVVDAFRTSSVPAHPTDPPQSVNNPVDSNVAIAIATAQVAAPVATILLPPYPFGFPPSFGLVPQPAEIPSEDPNKNRETTTKLSTTIPTTTTTERQQETITPAPSNIDNSFAQALPSNENTPFRQYYAPPAIPEPKPIKLKTTVEVVPVPLRYIAPPPLHIQQHHQHHHHHHHQAIKVVPHFHTFIPKPHKIIIRPMSSNFRIKSIKIPAGLVSYGPSKLLKKISQNYSQDFRINARDTEPTTFRSINRPISKPPRV